MVDDDRTLLEPASRAAGGFLIVPTEPPGLGEYWEGTGGVYAGFKRGSDGGPDYHLVITKVIVQDPAEERGNSEAFCDANCTWLDHHPDCVRAAAEIGKALEEG